VVGAGVLEEAGFVSSGAGAVLTRSIIMVADCLVNVLVQRIEP
jgi:hypothetical protein